MDDIFTELIRRYSPQEIMIQLYQLSLRVMENGNKGFLNIPRYVCIGNRVYVKDQIILPVWKIPEIVYWSIIKSNDYRNKRLCIVDLFEIIDEFYDFDDNRTDVSFLRDANINEISQFLFGNMGEQEQFQNLQWILNSFNRNYHILIGSKKIKRMIKNNCEQIIQKEIGVNVHVFCKILIMLIGICRRTQQPLKCNDIKFLGVKQEEFARVINYYTVDYDEIRSSSLGTQIFYTKPFVKTNKPEKVLAVTYHQVAFLVANGLYWGIRNYYNKSGTQEFVNAFGNMFEEYLLELSEQYLSSYEFEHLRHYNKKIADFRYEFEECIVLVEQKSALLTLDSKSQSPNMENIRTFLRRNIKEAYDQLEETAYRESGVKPVLKFILLYENIQNAQLMQVSMPEIFKNDFRCFIVGIAEFEQILRIRKENPRIWKKLIEQLLANEKGNLSIAHTLHNLNGFKYSNIFTKDNNYAQRYFDEMKTFYDNEGRYT